MNVNANIIISEVQFHGKLNLAQMYNFIDKQLLFHVFYICAIIGVRAGESA